MRSRLVKKWTRNGKEEEKNEKRIRKTNKENTKSSIIFKNILWMIKKHKFWNTERLEGKERGFWIISFRSILSCFDYFCCCFLLGMKLS